MEHQGSSPCSHQPSIAPILRQFNPAHILTPFFFFFNPLKPSGNYAPPALRISNSAFCICVFRMILSVNRDYFLQQRKPVDIRNGEVWCFLSGTDWILKYYLGELRLQKVKVNFNIILVFTLWSPKCSFSFRIFEQILLSSALCSQTPSTYVLPFGWNTSSTLT
jgi:hypothetical protein